MIVYNNFTPLNNITAPTEGPVTINTQGETVTVQVSGDGAGMDIAVLAQSDYQSKDWFTLMGFNLSTFESVDTITANGMYQFPIDGVGRFKIKVNAISGGAVTVFCKITKGV